MINKSINIKSLSNKMRARSVKVSKGKMVWILAQDIISKWITYELIVGYYVCEDICFGFLRV